MASDLHTGRTPDPTRWYEIDESGKLYLLLNEYVMVTADEDGQWTVCVGPKRQKIIVGWNSTGRNAAMRDAVKEAAIMGRTIRDDAQKAFDSLFFERS